VSTTCENQIAHLIIIICMLMRPDPPNAPLKPKSAAATQSLAMQTYIPALEQEVCVFHSASHATRSLNHTPESQCPRSCTKSPCTKRCRPLYDERGYEGSTGAWVPWQLEQGACITAFTWIVVSLVACASIGRLYRGLGMGAVGVGALLCDLCYLTHTHVHTLYLTWQACSCNAFRRVRAS
jgi:hypothetical protein